MIRKAIELDKKFTKKTAKGLPPKEVRDKADKLARMKRHGNRVLWWSSMISLPTTYLVYQDPTSTAAVFFALFAFTGGLKISYLHDVWTEYYLES